MLAAFGEIPGMLRLWAPISAEVTRVGALVLALCVGFCSAVHAESVSKIQSDTVQGPPRLAQNTSPGPIPPSEEDLDQQAAEIERSEAEKSELQRKEEEAKHPHAGLTVRSTTANSEVFVDGASVGYAPFARTDFAPGKHSIVVRRDGYADYSRDVVLVSNETMSLVADLSAGGVLRILSTPEGAEVRLDGELVGSTPVTRECSAGAHVVELRNKGYFDHKEALVADIGREKVYSVDLRLIPSGPSPEQIAYRRSQMTSIGARANPVGAVTIDFGLGYPYYVTGRVAVGAFNAGNVALDLGVHIQTFFELTEVAAAGRLQLVDAGPFTLGVRGELGGGTGIEGRNSLFFDVVAVASVSLWSSVVLAATGRFAYWSDRFCPATVQAQNGSRGEAFCTDTSQWQHLFGGTDPTVNRFSGDGLFAGLEASFVLDRLTSLFFQLEFPPLSGPTRLAYEGAVNGALASGTPSLYLTGGMTLKF